MNRLSLDGSGHLRPTQTQIAVVRGWVCDCAGVEREGHLVHKNITNTETTDDGPGTETPPPGIIVLAQRSIIKFIGGM